MEGVLHHAYWHDNDAVRSVSTTEVLIMTVKHTLQCNMAIIEQLPILNKIYNQNVSYFEPICSQNKYFSACVISISIHGGTTLRFTTSASSASLSNDLQQRRQLTFVEFPQINKYHTHKRKVFMSICWVICWFIRYCNIIIQVSYQHQNSKETTAPSLRHITLFNTIGNRIHGIAFLWLCYMNQHLRSSPAAVPLLRKCLFNVLLTLLTLEKSKSCSTITSAAFSTLDENVKYGCRSSVLMHVMLAPLCEFTQIIIVCLNSVSVVLASIVVRQWGSHTFTQSQLVFLLKEASRRRDIVSFIQDSTIIHFGSNTAAEYFVSSTAPRVAIDHTWTC